MRTYANWKGSAKTRDSQAPKWYAFAIRLRTPHRFGKPSVMTLTFR